MQSMAATSFYLYEGSEPIVLKKWRITQGAQLISKMVILTYVYPGDEKGEIHKLEAVVKGTVAELLIQEGETVQPKSALMSLESCKHEVIMKELCADCGANLRNLSYQNFDEVVASRSFSMVHIVPELKCSKTHAEKLDAIDEARLLQSRKLILLVDLDQTIIHTTNDDVPQDLKDVYHFQLYGPHSPWYHTRLRPHARKFLEQISKLYELHIFTFGARPYAHKIAKEILDPNGNLFSHRILSRDEFFDASLKTGNMASLFPRGDSMICIIDDREDVWNFAPNVIHVKPYTYFATTGDINCPKMSPIADTSTPYSSSDESMSGDTKDVIATPDKVESCDDQSTSLESKVPEDTPQPDLSTVNTECEKVADENKEECKEIVKNAYEDDDDFLLYLRDILVRIHRAYYDIYDEIISQNKDIDKLPDLKSVIPYVRKKVLRGVNLVFSGVIPTNTVPEKSMLWVLAKSFGAEVFHDVITCEGPLRTTHVIASKAGTTKLTKAKRAGNIHIVTPSWLTCSAARWERVDERLFPLKKDIASPTLQHDDKKEKVKVKVRVSPKGKERDQKRKSNKMLQPMLDFSAEELATMGREVEEACSSSDELSDEEDRCVKRKRPSSPIEPCDNDQTNNIAPNKSVNGDQEFQYNSDDSDKSSDSTQDQNISSGEEELVAEMERELFKNIT